MAGPFSQSTSCNASASLGRICVSVWTSSIVPMLLEENILAPASTEPKELEDVLPEDATEHQQETFSSFCHSVFERLHKRADGKAIERHITYSAQDDDWEWVWERQTDLPAGDYQKRFDELRDYTSGQAENNMSLLDKSASDVAAKISHSGAFRGSLRSFRDFVTQMAEDYINSFPGEDNAGSNSAVHGKAKKCIKGEMSDPAQLLALFHRLEYRSGLMSLADIFVHISCGPPKGLPCAEWDPIYTSSLLKEFGFARKDFDHVRAEVGRRGLFPRPMESQGEPWPKPADFLTIALLCAKLDDKQIEQKLHDLSTLTQEITKDISDDLMQVPIIQSKRREVMEALGMVIRSISPTPETEVV